MKPERLCSGCTSTSSIPTHSNTKRNKAWREWCLAIIL